MVLTARSNSFTTKLISCRRESLVTNCLITCNGQRWFSGDDDDDDDKCYELTELD